MAETASPLEDAAFTFTFEEDGTRKVLVDHAVLEASKAYLALHPRERAFLRALCEDRLDGDTAAVFADWLEENGRDAAGNRVRLLRPQKGDVLVLTVPRSRSRQDAEEALGGLRRDLPGVNVVASPDGFDARLLTGQAIHAAGWVRAEVADARVRAEREACLEIARRIRAGYEEAAVQSRMVGEEEIAWRLEPRADGAADVEGAIRRRGEAT